MSRRLLLIGVAILTAAAACGDAAPPSAADPTSTAPTTTTTAAVTTTTTAPASSTTTTVAAAAGPGHGGEVIIGDDQTPPTLNPYAPTGGDNFIVSLVAQALHTGVWDVDATMQRIPEVVTTLPTVANGGLMVNDDGTMTVRYMIRDEAVWADGTPISGDDFAFTYETLTTPPIADSHYGAYDDYALIDPDSLEVGPKTFGFTMIRPSLAHEGYFRWLIPKHQVEGSDITADWNEQPWFSGGPFILDTWERGGSDGLGSSGGRITLVRNPNYWKTHPESGEPLPYLDTVVFEFIPETEQIFQAFAARELDVINPPAWPPEIERLLGSAGESGAAVTIGQGPVWEHLNFQFGQLNRNEQSLNRYVEFRRAVAHAIDREALADEAQYGYGEAMSSYLDVFLPGVTAAAWDRYEYDPDKARKLIADLCAELGRDCAANPPTLIFSSTSNSDLRPRIADFLDESLSAVGIDVALELEDSQRYFGMTLDQGNWDVGLWAWVGDAGYRAAVEIHDVFDPDAPPPEGSNYYRWGTGPTAGQPQQEGGPDGQYDVNQGPSLVIDEHTARFAELLDGMGTTVDERQLTELILEAEAILADQVVIIPLFSRLVASAVWADEIAGFEMNPSLAGHTWNIEEWYRVDR